MTTAGMTAPVPWPRLERAGWFWIFVAASVAVHAVFFLQIPRERVAVALEAAPRIMSVRMVQVRPAPPEPAVEPQTIAPQPEIFSPRTEPLAAPVKAKAVAPKLAGAATAKPNAPAFVEARPLAASNRPPHYPDLARRNGWQGLCLVRAAVGANGRAVAVSLARSSGYGILDQAALTAVKRWKFTPRMVRGTPAESTVEVPVNFSLR